MEILARVSRRISYQLHEPSAAIVRLDNIDISNLVQATLFRNRSSLSSVEEEM